MPYMQFSARCECLKLPEAKIISLTSLKTHETLHRQALSYTFYSVSLPHSLDTSHPSSTQMGSSYHISFNFAQSHSHIYLFMLLMKLIHHLIQTRVYTLHTVCLQQSYSSSRNVKHLLVLVCQIWRFVVFYSFGQSVTPKKKKSDKLRQAFFNSFWHFIS